jgi:hypothetical protein
VTISGLTVSNGVLNSTANNDEGGGLFNGGTLTIANSTISGNSGTGPTNNGGGISNAGTLTVTNSIISGNKADNNSSGGGIHNTGTMTITNSTISGNSANNSTPGGGGIKNEGTATITGTTISGNTVINSSGGKGAGIYNVTGSLTLTNCTVSGNNGDTGVGRGDRERRHLDRGQQHHFPEHGYGRRRHLQFRQWISEGRFHEHDQSAAIQNSGLAPSNPAESAIIATLAPGNYTAIAQGVNAGTGVGLIEVFALP